MKIGIDCSRSAKTEQTGTERYSTQIIKHLGKIDYKNQYILYTPKDIKYKLGKIPKNFIQRIIPFTKLWTQVRLSWEMIKDKNKLDVLFVPSHTIPIIHPKKTVVTVHDLGFLHFPELYSSFELRYQKFGLDMALKHATQIITPSLYTKKDIVKNFGLDPKKITVIYHGYNDKLYKPRIYPKTEQENPYILYIGRLEDKKNTVGLIETYALLRREPKIKHKLVLAGKPGHGYEKVKEAIEKLPAEIKNDVVELGYVEEKEMLSWLKNADIFFFPSYFEGFGLPIIEAMACGVPVVASNVTSIPEVAGSAAILVDPHKPFEMAVALSKLINDSKLRKALVSKGKVRASMFSWDKAAEQTLEVLEDN